MKTELFDRAAARLAERLESAAADLRAVHPDARAVAVAVGCVASELNILTDAAVSLFKRARRASATKGESHP